MPVTMDTEVESGRSDSLGEGKGEKGKKRTKDTGQRADSLLPI